MTEQATLRLTARRVVLDPALAEALSARGVTALAVQADEVLLDGALRLPGCTVSVDCRVLVSRDGLLDLSAPPAPDPAPPAAADGTAASPDGQDGKPGVAGARGGDARILCQRIDGALRICADGAPGGASQSGGNGVKPATRNGRDGTFAKLPKGFGPWGGKVVKNGDGSAGFLGIFYPDSTRLVTVAYGEPGPAGSPGGNGGAPGTPGRGGDGGDIAIACLEPPAIAPALASAGGAPGACGQGGRGGPGGDGGTGGLNRMYYKHGKYVYNVSLNANLKEAKWAREDWKVPERAPASAAKGPVGKHDKTVLSAEPGRSGRCSCGRPEPASLSEGLEGGYLQQVLVWAVQAPDRGEPMARWGLALLDRFPGKPDAEHTALRESLERLLALVAETTA